MDPVVIALTTFPDEETARQIGTTLVESQLAACVTLLPASESIYRWKGTIHRDREIPALVKTTAALAPAAAAALRARHPYECPEWLIFPATDGLPAYLDWIRVMTGNPQT